MRSIWDVFGVGYTVYRWYSVHGSADEGELAVNMPLRQVWLLPPFEMQI